MSRLRETGLLVYPTRSRRSGGLSVGINLFSDAKVCSFDCPYCEVFPFSNKAGFSLQRLETELRETLKAALEGNEPIRDIAFSGSGEPTLSPEFPAALALVAGIRRELVPAARLVLITCGTGLLREDTFGLLRDAALGPDALDVWLKIDAGTEDWYRTINRGAVSHGELLEGARRFVAAAPATIQSMLCRIGDAEPGPEEAAAWERLLVELAGISGGRIRRVQVYGKSRPSPEDAAVFPLPPEALHRRADSLRRALAGLGEAGRIPVEVYL